MTMQARTEPGEAPGRGFGDELVRYLEPYRLAVLGCPMLEGCRQGTLDVGRIRAWVAEQYAYVDAFPSWIGAIIRKVDEPSLREALVANLFGERTHPTLWLQFAEGWGLSTADVRATVPCPEMQALNDYLGRLAIDGHIVEAGAALCVALEGMSKAIIDDVGPALHRHYNGRDGVALDRRALMWLEAHAEVDPTHGAEGVSLVAHYATTPELEARALFAGRRALEYLRLGFDGVHRRA